MNSDIIVSTINLNGLGLPGWPIRISSDISSNHDGYPAIIPRGWKLIIEVSKDGLGTAKFFKIEPDNVKEYST